MKLLPAVVVLVAWTAVASTTVASADDKKAAPEAAATDEVIGLLDVRVEGVSAAAAEVFTQQIEESLEISGLKVAPRKQLHQYLAGTPWNSACLIGDCLRELQLRADVHRVIEVALVTNGPSYHYVINLLDTTSGKSIGQLARKCDVCTTEEAFAAAALAVVELVNGVGDATPAAMAPVPRSDRSRARARTRVLGYVLVGAAVAAGAASYYLYSDDRDGYGAAAGGVAGGLGVAGVTAIGVSFTF